MRYLRPAKSVGGGTLYSSRLGPPAGSSLQAPRFLGGRDLFGGRSSASEGVQHAVGLEPLRDEVPIRPLKLAIVRELLPPSQAPGERRFEEGQAIYLGKRLVRGPLGNRGGDAGAFDLAFDAQLAAPLDRQLSPGDRCRGTCVVHGPLSLQAVYDRIDCVFVVPPPRETLGGLRS